MNTRIVVHRNDEVAAYLGVELVGEPASIRSISPFPNRAPHSISFLSGAVASHMPMAPEGCTVVTPAQNIPVLAAAGFACIPHPSPKYALACAMRDMLLEPRGSGVDPSARIGSDVRLAENVYVGPGAVLDGEISVGHGSRIGANTVLRNVVRVGSQVTIRCGSVIGEDAFSFGFSSPSDNSGDSVRFPSFGGVVIEDGVEIGNNCVIARGLFDDTLIRRSARINDLVHMGNSVEIGPGAMIMAQTDISGRVVIGAGCWIGQSAAIRQGVVIGDRAQVGMGAVVTRDVESGTVVYGVPARIQRTR